MMLIHSTWKRCCRMPRPCDVAVMMIPAHGAQGPGCRLQNCAMAARSAIGVAVGADQEVLRPGTATPSAGPGVALHHLLQPVERQGMHDATGAPAGRLGGRQGVQNGL